MAQTPVSEHQAVLSKESAVAPQLQLDWKTFLSQQDPHWNRIPTKWEESPFLGNGWMGTMVYQDGPQGRHQLRIDVHHAGVTDHQSGSGMYATARLPIGHFIVETVGHIQDCDLRLDLWNAELTGQVNTSEGSVKLHGLIPANRPLMAFDFEPTDGEAKMKITFRPAAAVSPRLQNRAWPENHARNPPHRLQNDGPIEVCEQPLHVGGGHATAWQVTQQGSSQRLLVSVAHRFPQGDAAEIAIDQVRQASPGGLKALIPEHQKWWHEFYPTSFVSIPDPFWQSFYWIQMYKLGAATRREGCLIDNHGPWLQATAWPYATWNLNVQLSYWPFLASGHLSEAESLTRHLDDHREQLRANVTPEAYRHDSYAIGRAATENLDSPLRESSHNHWEIGNLTWAMHNVFLHYRHTMDDELLAEVIFPLLKGSVNYYFHWLEKGDDGKLHLPTTYSPEYGDAPDCNYDLALIRWGCETLIWIDQRLGLHDPLADQWSRTLRDLTAYPEDDQQGFLIGRDVPMSRSHRHYSHLLMIYPFYEVNVEQATGRERIEKSLVHWHSMPGSLQGYSFTGSSSIFSALGEGDQALEKLEGLKGFLLPNTMYREGGPVIETPLSAAQSIHDMLVQSWGDVIRVFPAVPSAWKDVAIDRLRTEGAFELSAKRSEGETQWVFVKSLAGEPFRIRPGITGEVQCTSTGKVTEIELGLFQLELAEGESARFQPVGSSADGTLSPVLKVDQPIFGLPGGDQG